MTIRPAGEPEGTPCCDDDAGFTLIELLVVVIIIGILAAIAIPVYLQQREKAFDKMAAADARNMATAQFAVMSDAGRFTDDWTVLLEDGGFRGSDDGGKMSHAVCHVTSGSGFDEFLVGAKHAGSPDVWIMSSSEGIVKIAGIDSLEGAVASVDPVDNCVEGNSSINVRGPAATP